MLQGARKAGRFSGRLVTTALDFQKSFRQLPPDNSLKELRNELQQGLGQVRDLQRDLNRRLNQPLRNMIHEHMNETEKSEDTNQSTVSAQVVQQQQQVRQLEPESESLNNSNPNDSSKRGLGAFGMDVQMHSAGLKTELMPGGADLLLEAMLDDKVSTTLQKMVTIFDLSMHLLAQN